MDVFNNLSYYSYPAFMQLMEKLVADGLFTGDVKGDDFIFWTKLSLQRLQRWEKTLTISDEAIAEAKKAQPQIWWVITESWCGDAAQTLPVMVKMVEASGGNIELRLILRDTNPQIMDKYLTNGGRSIPILIAVSNATGEELFHWGPRPSIPQAMMMNWRRDNNGQSFLDIEKEIHGWYAKDKGVTFQAEILRLMRSVIISQG
ncbi:MAG: thioredoxin family protein [Flavipsychrobacter sp.]|nr:thioredoxin family protein [Flavipsychrobacter sp.]